MSQLKQYIREKKFLYLQFDEIFEFHKGCVRFLSQLVSSRNTFGGFLRDEFSKGKSHEVKFVLYRILMAEN